VVTFLFGLCSNWSPKPYRGHKPLPTSSAEQEATGIVFQSCLSSTQLDVQRSQQRADQRERRQWTDSESAVERSLYGRSMALQLRASSASPALRD